MRGYRARRAAQQAKMLARSRLRAVAVDGRTCRAVGTRVHLLGAAGHGGHYLDHLEVGLKHNKTSYFTELLERYSTPQPRLGQERTFTEHAKTLSSGPGSAGETTG